MMKLWRVGIDPDVQKLQKTHEGYGSIPNPYPFSFDFKYYFEIGFNAKLLIMSGRKCVGWKAGVRIGKICPKGQDWIAKTVESISKGIANCNGLNRGCQITNYNT